MFHHDIQMNSNGQIVGITNEVQNGLPGDGLLALDTYGQKVWSWSTFDEIKEAATKAYLHEQIMDLPEAYNHDATQLSGGQQQRDQEQEAGPQDDPERQQLRLEHGP